MIELPPNYFTFGKYNADIPLDVYQDNNKLFKWLLQYNIIGYAKTTGIRPRTDSIAIMIETEHGEYWNHIPFEVFDRLK